MPIWGCRHSGSRDVSHWTGVCVAVGLVIGASLLPASAQERREESRPPVTTVPVPPERGFIATQPPEWVGTVVRGTTRTLMLGQGDEIQILPAAGRTLKPGDRLTVARVVRPVRHPHTGDRIGDLIVAQGVVVIRPTSGEQIYGEIVTSYTEIRAGDQLLPYEPPPRPLIASRGPVRIQGLLIGAREELSAIGQGHIVYIDRGRRDKVEPGLLFMVFHGERPFGLDAYEIEVGLKRMEVPKTPPRDPLPRESIGQLVVLSVEERTATVLVLQSKQLLGRGDRVVSEVEDASVREGQAK